MNQKSKKVHADSQIELKSKNPQRQIRVDTYGQQILKGQKNHKIAFKEHIKTIHIVENWKLYNLDHVDKEDDSCPCQLI
ncbi:unnamed protein product [Paramecium octaurelia]|uniref:Uncharacterized protein n=1 Tax=Paramecium octaurelia TaxID=43137 RepID=A0A8S1TP92_PAROT|nr:unnamed protein product [Paramecium octaurelia]